MKVRVKIKGIKPFIFNKFNIEMITDMAKPKEGKSGNNPYEWKKTFFHDDGVLYIPDNYVFSSLKNGAVYTKSGRSSIQKSWISGVIVETAKCYLNRKMFPNWEKIEPEDIPTDSSKEVYVDVRMTANPMTKGRNVRYRVACSPGWETEFVLEADKTVVSQAQVKKVIEDTGKLVGIGDARTLGYGRFSIEECEFD